MSRAVKDDKENNRSRLLPKDRIVQLDCAIGATAFFRLNVQFNSGVIKLCSNLRAAEIKLIYRLFAVYGDARGTWTS